jgi:hypothetical protein
MERLLAHFKHGDIYTANEQIRKDLTCIKDLYLHDRLREDDLIYLRNGNVPVEITMNDYIWLENVKQIITWYKDKGKLPLNKENKALYRFWVREENYINENHSYAKFISLNKDAAESVNELQEIISKERRSRGRYHHRALKINL